MRKFRFRSILVLVAALSLVAAACGGGDDDTTDSADGGGGDDHHGRLRRRRHSAGDLLAQICDDGVITISTDPAYPPQSSLNPETGEYEGFDIDVATEIANRLGVEVAWETPKWEAITAGNWQGRWDMSVGSMTVNEERAEVLDFIARLLLHAGLDRRPRRQRRHLGRPARPGDDRRVRWLHLRLLPARHS